MSKRLTADDRHYLTSYERRLLYARLDTRDVEFILAVLNMAPKVGLLDALPYVSALASGKYSANRSAPLLREGVRVCQELLGGRLKVLDSRNILLRSTEASPVRREELVRPLHGSHQSDPAELVRPASTAANV
jgi:hypothetical protein